MSDSNSAIPGQAASGAGSVSFTGSPTLPVWREPRVRLFANGAPIQGAVEADVLSNNHYAADRFTAVVALGVDLWANAAYWASQTDILLDVQFSLDGGGTYTSLIQGLVDTVAIDVLTQSLRIEGRDLTAAMIENRTQETFANRTSSEIAVILAQRHNLTPVVTETTTPVGRYYQSEVVPLCGTVWRLC